MPLDNLPRALGIHRPCGAPRFRIHSTISDRHAIRGFPADLREECLAASGINQCRVSVTHR
jgi:hypothetical protein